MKLTSSVLLKVIVLLILLVVDATFEIPIKRHLSLKKNGGENILTKAPYFNDFLTIDIQLGTPQKSATLLMMTGSTHIWISNLVQFYNESFSIEELNKPAFISTDGHYNVSGQWFQDVMFIEGRKIVQPFGMVKEIKLFDQNNTEDKTFSANGILGLSHMHQSKYMDGEPISLADNLLKSFLHSTYTLYLGEHKQGLSDGVLTVGNYDYKHCSFEKQEIVQLTSDFTFPLYNYFYSTYLKFYHYKVEKSSMITLVDSGFSTLGLEKEMFAKMRSMIRTVLFDENLGLYTVPCNEAKNLDNITISFKSIPDEYNYYRGSVISDVKHSITPSDFVIDIDLPSGQCVLAITELDSAHKNDIQILLGTPFIRSVCLTFDLEQNQLVLTERKTLEEQKSIVEEK